MSDCEICEVERSDLDEAGICPACRADIEASSSECTDPVEIVLSAHWLMTPLCTLDRQVCRCGWRIDSGPAYHRRHMAEMIYKALGLPGPKPWIDGPLVEHPQPQPGTYMPDGRDEMKRCDWEAMTAEARRSWAEPKIKCIERECSEPAGTPWGPLWCADHDDARIHYALAQMEELSADRVWRSRLGRGV